MANATSYHHGDLRTALLRSASNILEHQGIEALSLRKLADEVGVSRSALYHHFKDKNALLCAVAAQGFEMWMGMAKALSEATDRPVQERFREFVHRYVQFAADHPQVYDLMFGRTLWQTRGADDDLKEVAYPAFQHQVTMTKWWQDAGILPVEQDPLRLAQVNWATLHGIARLLIDGIYADRSHISEMCDCAADVLMK